MNEQGPAMVIHFYEVRLRETLCGLRGFEHRSTKHPHGVTCHACVGLLHQRLGPEPASPAGDDRGSTASA